MTDDTTMEQQPREELPAASTDSSKPSSVRGSWSSAIYDSKNRKIVDNAISDVDLREGWWIRCVWYTCIVHVCVLVCSCACVHCASCVFVVNALEGV